MCDFHQDGLLLTRNLTRNNWVTNFQKNYNHYIKVVLLMEKNQFLLLVQTSYYQNGSVCLTELISRVMYIQGYIQTCCMAEPTDAA